MDCRSEWREAEHDISKNNAMRVLNVHEREIAAPPAAVGALIDSLASDNDRLWPRTMWPAMRFDRPLGIGAVGGHGPIAYVVEEFTRGQSVQFRCLGPRGFNGQRRFEVLPQGGHLVLLRHTIEMSAEGVGLIAWPLFIRPLHDALLEDALALAQASLGLVPTVRPWSLWVKVLRWLMTRGRARPQQTPTSASRPIGESPM